MFLRLLIYGRDDNTANAPLRLLFNDYGNENENE